MASEAVVNKPTSINIKKYVTYSELGQLFFLFNYLGPQGVSSLLISSAILSTGWATTFAGSSLSFAF